MSINWFVGVDISKKTLDFAFCRKNKEILDNSHFVTENSKKGIVEALRWLSSRGAKKHNMWICMEHTGEYTLELWKYLEEKKIRCTVANAVNIKRSLDFELSRGKTDKVDAYRIAWFCAKNIDELELSKLPSEAFLRLKMLSSERRSYIRQRASFLSKRNTYHVANYSEVETRLQAVIKALSACIKAIEKEILELIQSDEEIAQNYAFLTSIPGISFVNALNTIIYTLNFMAFKNARQYACYAGVAPFAYSSGTSTRGKTKVSKLGNRQIKADLTQAAKCAVIWDSDLKHYYTRKSSEGKDYGKIMNVVKFKLIERMFAVVLNKRAYVKMSTYLS